MAYEFWTPPKIIVGIGALKDAARFWKEMGKGH